VLPRIKEPCWKNKCNVSKKSKFNIFSVVEICGHIGRRFKSGRGRPSALASALTYPNLNKQCLRERLVLKEQPTRVDFLFYIFLTTTV
jgi:hypothetical protein